VGPQGVEKAPKPSQRDLLMAERQAVRILRSPDEL
jgi:NADH-quinone oxidoreductase subunit B